MRARFLRLRSELNNTRLTLLVTLLFTMLVATIFPTPAIRFTVALFCAGPFVSYLVARLFARSLHATRSVAAAVSVGDTVHGRIQVHNAAPYPVFFAQINIGECVPSPSGRPALMPTDGADRIFATLLPGEHASVPVQWQATRRGIWQLSPVLAGATDPLGLSTVLSAHTAPHTITVLPRPLHLMKLGFLTGSRNGTRPLSHAASVNEALDFHGIRLWRPGEGMRRVHWKSTARTGELHVIEWEEDLSADLIVLLDVQVGARHAAGAVSEGLETGITVAASVAAHLLANGNSFELFFWQGDPQTAGKGKAPTLKLCRHRSRGMAGLAATLQVLAEIAPLPWPEASLVNLAARAKINSEYNVLLITMGEADVSDTVNRLYATGIPSRQCTVLSLEPEGVENVPMPDQLKRTGYSLFGNGKKAGRAGAKAPVAARTVKAVPGVRTRRLQRGESLTALLERD